MDDTTSGIVAGLNAGCWTVGVAKTVMNSFLNLNISDQMKNLQGNYVGMTEAEMEKCDTVQLEKKIENARNILYKVVINFNTTTSLNRRLKAYQNFHNNFSFSKGKIAFSFFFTIHHLYFEAPVFTLFLC